MNERRSPLRIVGGDFRGRPLAVPHGQSVRPMRSRVRESLFTRLGDEIRGAHVLDVFSGSGAIAIEAMSRGAWRAVAIENHRHVLPTLEHNLETLGLARRVTVVKVDAYALIDDDTPLAEYGPFRLVTLDPPFPDYAGCTVAGQEGEGEQKRDPWRLASALLSSSFIAEDALLAIEAPATIEVTAPPQDAAVEFDRRYGDTRLLIWRRHAGRD